MQHFITIYIIINLKTIIILGIDVWMATCLFFVFAGLIEFAYVNVLSRVEKRRRSTIKTANSLSLTDDQYNAFDSKVNVFL